MADESQDNKANSEQHNKEEHIKQRLKELGVSEDSERPRASFISKYGKYFLPVVIVVLVAAYWYEYTKQPAMDESQLAGDNDVVTQQPSQVYPYGQPMQRPEPPAWVKERRAQMPQPPEPPEWVTKQRAQAPQPPAWVQEQRKKWLQQQQAMYNQGNINNNANKQLYYGGYPAYPPQPYWHNYPGYYSYNGYAPGPIYPGPYAGGYPYYNGW